MKITNLGIIFPKRKVTEEFLRRMVKEFSVLLILYLILHLCSSYYNTTNQIQILPTGSPLRFLTQFPVSSIISLILISICIIVSFMNRKICFWILAEDKKEISKFIALEVLNASVILFLLSTLLTIDIISKFFGKMDFIEYIIFLVINIVFILYYSILYIWRNVMYSYYYLGQEKKRAFLVLLIPISSFYLILKGLI